MPGIGKFSNVTSGLDSIGSSLDGVVQKARTAQGVIGETKRAIDGMGSSLDALDQKTDASVERQERARKVLEENTKAVTALDDIYAAVTERGNNFSQDVQLQLELVRLGGQSLQDFLSLYGDALIQLEDGSHRIRDLFSGADYDVYRKRIQELIDQVEQGGDRLGVVLAFLRENASTLTKGLQEMIEGFQKGEVSLQRLLDFLQRTRQDFAGTDFEALAQALLQGLAQGELT